MKNAFLTLICAFFVSFTQTYSHPSWGIVVNEKGDVFFADVMHNGIGTLWKLDREGNVHKVLTDFHAHDLQFDSDGNLWIAENRWIQGVVEGEGENLLLRISPQGKIDTVIFTDDWDQFYGGTFALSPDGVYFTLNGRIYHKKINGSTTLFLDHTFERIVTLYSDAEYNLWITDKAYKNGTLFLYNNTEGLREYATGLLPVAPENPVFDEPRHQLLYGIAKDNEGYLYVAENSARNLIRIAPDGTKKIVYSSTPPWHPIGAAFFNKTTFIMEAGFDHTNIGPRILRMDPDGTITELFNHETYEGQSTTPGKVDKNNRPKWWFLMILLPIIAILTYTIRFRKKQHTG
jgi:streptogramin lyase